jgi:hypothetical protein
MPFHDELIAQMHKLNDLMLYAMGHEVNNSPGKFKWWLVRVAWRHLRSPDGIALAWAYAILARFNQVFNVSDWKMITRILMEIFQMSTKEREVRELIRRALNIFIPSLPLRVTKEQWRDNVLKHMHHALVDDSQSTTALTHHLSIVADHHRLFYSYRERIIPYVMTLSGRIGLDRANAPMVLNPVVSSLNTVSVWHACARLEHALHLLETGLPTLPDVAPVGMPAQRVSVAIRLRGSIGPQYPTPPGGYGAYTLAGKPTAALLDGSSSSMAAYATASYPPLDEQYTDWVPNLVLKLVFHFSEWPEHRPFTRNMMSLFATCLRLWPDVNISARNMSRCVAPPLLRVVQNNAAVVAHFNKANGMYLQTLVANPPPAAPPVQPDMPFRHADTSAHMYYSTLLEVLMSLLATEGHARDFCADNAGFLMDTLGPVFAISEKRTHALLRRFYRRMLFLYPLVYPPSRMVHVRFYPWTFSCMAMRLTVFAGYSLDKQTETAKTAADMAAVAPEIKNKRVEESSAIKIIAEGLIPAPITSPGAPPFVAPEGLNSRWDAAAIEKARTVAQAFFPFLTLEKAKRMVEADEEDDQKARAAWGAVKDLSLPAPGEKLGEPSPFAMLGLVRLARDIIKLAPLALSPLLNCLFATFTYLFNVHVVSDKCEGAVPPGSAFAPFFERLGAADADQRMMMLDNLVKRVARNSAVSILLPVLCQLRAGWGSMQRSPLTGLVLKLLQKSADSGITRTCMQVVTRWIPAPAVGDAITPYGLSTREKVNLLKAMETLGMIVPINMGERQLSYYERQQGLADSFPFLQSSYFRLLLQLYTGNEMVGKDFLFTLRHCQQLASLLGGSTGAKDGDDVKPVSDALSKAQLLPHLRSAASRPSLWATLAVRDNLAPAVASGDLTIRDRCLRLFIAESRVRRIRELQEEVGRYRTAVGVMKTRARVAQTSKLGLQSVASNDSSAAYLQLRTSSGFVASSFLPNPFRDKTQMLAMQLSSRMIPVAGGSALPGSLCSNPNHSATLSGVTTTSTIGESAFSADTGSRYSLLSGDESQAWHQNLDSATASALHAAYKDIAGGAPVDIRSRFLAFSGMHSGEGSPLLAIQDVLALMDVMDVSAYALVPTAVRAMLLNARAPVAKQMNSGDAMDESEDAKSDSAFVKLFGALSIQPKADAAAEATASPELLAALFDACGSSIDIAMVMWRHTFPAAWKALSAQDRKRLTPHLANFAARDSHLANTSGVLFCMELALGHSVKDREKDFGVDYTSVGGNYAWTTANVPATVEEGLLSGTNAIVSSSRDEVGSGGLGAVPAALENHTQSYVSHIMLSFLGSGADINFSPELLAYLAKSAAPDMHIAALERLVEKAVDTCIAASRRLEDAVVRARMHLQGARTSGRGLSTAAAEGKLDGASADLLASSLETGLGLKLRLAILDDDISAALASNDRRGDVDHITELNQARLHVAEAKDYLGMCVHSLVQAYSSQGMEDMLTGLRRRFVTTITSMRGLDLESEGRFSEAADLYFTAMTTVGTRERAQLGDSTLHALQVMRGTAMTDAQRRKVLEIVGVPVPAAATEAAAVDPGAPASLPLVTAASASDAQTNSRSAMNASLAALANKISSFDKAAKAHAKIAKAAVVSPMDDLMGGDDSKSSSGDAIARTLGSNQMRICDAITGAGKKVTTDELSRLLSGQIISASSAKKRRLASSAVKSAVTGTVNTIEAAFGTSLGHLRMEFEQESQLTTAIMENKPQALEPLSLQAVTFLAVDGSPDSSTWKLKDEFMPSQSEFDLWEERWVETQKTLGNWMMLKEYSKNNFQENGVVAESALQLGQLQELKNILDSRAIFGPGNLGLDTTRDPDSKIFDAEHILLRDPASAHSPVHMNMHLDSAVALFIRAWSLLPPHASAAHEKLLLSAQKIQEIREGAKMLDAVKNVRSGADEASPEFGGLRSAWRDRMPQKTDGMHFINRIINFRELLYGTLENELTVARAPANVVGMLSDRFYMALRLAHMARRLGLRDLGLFHLSRTNVGVMIDTEDMFLKIREQVLVHLPSKPDAFAVFLREQRTNARRNGEVIPSPALDQVAVGASSSVFNGLAESVLGAPAVGQLRSALDLLHRQDLDALLLDRVKLDDDGRGRGDDARVVQTHKAELFRLRGLVMENIGDDLLPSAYAAYSHSVLLQRRSAKSWLSWASFLDRIYQKVCVDVANPETLNAPNAPQNHVLQTALVISASSHQPVEGIAAAAAAAPTSIAATETDAPSFLVKGSYPDKVGPALASSVAVQAVCAFLQAIALNCTMPAVQLSRVFQLLASENGNADVSRAVLAYAGIVPAWLWTHWVPHLLSDLERQEGAAAAHHTAGKAPNVPREILAALAVTYPQVLYYPLRAFVAHKTELIGAYQRYKSHVCPPALLACQVAGQQLLALTKRAHVGSHDVEAFVDELVAAKKETVEEELYNALSVQIASIVERQTAAVLAGAQSSDLEAGALCAVISTLVAEILNGDAQKTAAAAIPATQALRSREAVARYQSALLRDFAAKVPAALVKDTAAASKSAADVANPHLPKTAGGVVRRLKVWRSKVLAGLTRDSLVPGAGGASLHLATVSPGLLDLEFTGVEIPGQNGGSMESEPFPDRCVRLASVDSRVQVVLSPSSDAAATPSLVRRLIFVGTDGKRHHFSLRTAPAWPVMQSEQRVAQMQAMVNGLLSRFSMARSRKLHLNVRANTPLGGGLQLVPDSPALCSFEGLLDQFLAANGLSGEASSADVTALLQHYESTLAAAVTAGGAADKDRARLQAYRRMCGALPSSALSSTLSSSMASVEAYAALRQRLVTQLGSSALLGHLLGVVDRSPNRLLVLRNSAQLFHTDARAQYRGDSFLVGEDLEAVPFRLTRNMTTMMTPQGVLGPFVSSFVSTNRAIVQHAELAHAFLSIFVRDDLPDSVFCGGSGVHLQQVLHPSWITASATDTNAFTGAFNALVAFVQASQGAVPPAVVASAKSLFASMGKPAAFSALVQRIVLRLFDRMEELQTAAMPMKPAADANTIATPVSASLSAAVQDGQPLSKVHTLVATAMSEECLSKMAAAWQPWF